MRFLKHLGFILTGLFVFLGLPFLACRERISARYFSGSADAVSSASLVIPDQPSGEYLVLIDQEKHRETLTEWTDFFEERPVGVIFEDIDCLTAEGDENGKQMAERYQARLPENQMNVRSEEALMAVSKAQWGICDVMIFSKEMAEAYALEETIGENPDIRVLHISGTEGS